MYDTEPFNLHDKRTVPSSLAPATIVMEGGDGRNRHTIYCLTNSPPLPISKTSNDTRGPSGHAYVIVIGMLMADEHHRSLYRNHWIPHPLIIRINEDAHPLAFTKKVACPKYVILTNGHPSSIAPLSPRRPARFRRTTPKSAALSVSGRSSTMTKVAKYQ